MTRTTRITVTLHDEDGEESTAVLTYYNLAMSGQNVRHQGILERIYEHLIDCGDLECTRQIPELVEARKAS